MTTPVRLAGLLSGGGRTLLNLADHIDAGTLPAQIVTVIASGRGASGVARLEARGFPVEIADPRELGSEAAASDRISALIAAARVDLVCLCGYLRHVRLDPPLAGRTINIHPALLPDFGGKGMYGDHVHSAVLDAGRLYSGCTVHHVDDVYDHGPTILQRLCPVFEDDSAESLAARVFLEECEAYPAAIRLVSR